MWCARCIPVTLTASICIMCFWLGQFAVAVQKGEKIVRAESVVAESFELVGPDGRQTASLQSMGAGEGVLILRGGHGKGRLRAWHHATRGTGLRHLTI